MPKAPKKPAVAMKTAARIHDQKLSRGEGGELHQTAAGATPVLTTAQGGPVSDDQNSLKAGRRGPTALEDFHFREKIFHFDHERIPERVVHARGYGAHGYFETYKSLARYTRADIFQRAGEKTPAFVRFSTVAGSKGSMDLARNVRDESTFVKFIWKPKLGMQSVLWNEAVKINGADPDYHRRDLWQAIQTGNFPEWELNLQLFDQDFADKFDFDILDPTKIIPEEILKPVPVGRLVLDRMPDNFFAETEQVAFMTQNVPPGIDFSNDPLLQGRNFSYLDTQLKRLGSPNFTHIPINAPKCPFAHFQQDGHMAMRNPVGRVNYQPNSWGEGPRESPERGHRSFPEEIEGVKQRIRPESFADHYSQARQFFISQTKPEQDHIIAALTFELSKVERPEIRERMVAHLLNIHPDLAQKVATGLGLKKMPNAADAAVPTREDLKPSPALSIIKNGPKRFEGRKLGILVTDGTDAALLKALQAAVAKAGALTEIIAPKVGGVKAGDGSWIEAQQMIDGGPSVLYDAVALLPSEARTALLLQHAPARDFVADAFQHCKFIGHTAAAKPLLDKSGVQPDAGIVPLIARKDIDAFVGALGALRLWDREPKVKLQPEPEPGRGRPASAAAAR